MVEKKAARDRSGRGRSLLPYAEAVRTLVREAAPLDRAPQRLPLEDCRGRVLAEEVALDRDEPPVPRSAMDGFAVRSGDGAARRRIVGTVHAGDDGRPRVGAGEAVAVMTGGTVPEGADAVVPVERTRRDGDALEIEEAPARGRHVRPAGEMGAAGRAVLAAGRRLGAADLGAAAGCGADPLLVHARPRVVLLSTGDEVIPLRQRPREHQVRDSNRLAGVLQLRAAGAEVVRADHVRDDRAALEEAVDAALGDADLLVTIGGVSMGEKDLLPGVFAGAGLRCWFHGVAVQPGKPLWAGGGGRGVALGLPGNPLSSFVILELFGRALVDRLGGALGPHPRPRALGLAGGGARARGRVRFLPSRVTQDLAGRAVVTPCRSSGSGDWTSLAQADALMEVPPGTSVERGEPVRWLPLGT